MNYPTYEQTPQAPARVYVASSWRNERQPEIVAMLREWNHQVYDFRNPPHGQGGFSWSEIDPDWQNWDSHAYCDILLNHATAAHGFLTDFRAMQWADTFVLVMPCGRSAHLELGWACGRKRTIILLEDGEPELMYLLADHVCADTGQLCDLLGPKVGARQC